MTRQRDEQVAAWRTQWQALVDTGKSNPEIDFLYNIYDEMHRGDRTYNVRRNSKALINYKKGRLARRTHASLDDNPWRDWMHSNNRQDMWHFADWEDGWKDEDYDIQMGQTNLEFQDLTI